MRRLTLVLVALLLFVPGSTLGQTEPTAPSNVNPDAWALYLDGVELREEDTPASYRRAAEYFSRAIEADPDFALAHAGLATVHALRSNTEDIVRRARKAATEALRLNPNLPEAHIAMGLIEEIHHYSWSEAARHFQRAIQLDPDNREAHREYGWLLIRTGQVDMGLAHMKKARELAPRSVLGNDAVAVALFYSGRYDEAIEQYHRVLELDPNYALAYLMLAQAYTHNRQFGKAEEAFRRAATELGWNFFQSPEAGYLYAVSGREAAARQVLEDLKQQWKKDEVSAYDVAVVLAGWEDEEAMRWLERAHAAGEMALDVRVDPRFAYLHDTERFQTLMENMNLK